MTPELLTGLAMAAVLLAASALATRPWWRRGAAAVQDRRAANVAAYRLRLAELDAELAAGLILPEEAASLRAELDARLLRDAGEATAGPAGAADRRRPLGVLLVTLALAAFGAAWYLQAGSWRLQQEIAKGPDEAPADVDPRLAGLVAQLEARLKDKPDDAQGWLMLGRSYFVLQRYGEAAQAYAEANRREPAPNAEWLTDEAEALAFAGDREVSGRAAELVEQALKLAPDYGKALWYGGLASAQAGDFERARARWNRLLADKELPPTMREALQARLRTLDEIAAGAPAEAAAGSDAPAAAAASGPGLKVRVTLAPELAAQVPKGATLFVFAKAESGPQMPLAVQRLADPVLPLELTLDDSMAMAPALRLSQFERYAITARLSAAGSAQAQSGDLEGRIAATRAEAGGATLELRIDHRVP